MGILSRRSFLTGLIAAPAIVHVSSLMLLRGIPLLVPPGLTGLLLPLEEVNAKQLAQYCIGGGTISFRPPGEVDFVPLWNCTDFSLVARGE